MTKTMTFLCGSMGNLAVEIVLLYQYFQTDSVIPPRYKKFSFWLVRALVGVVGGGLALAYGIQTPLLAANVGAAVVPIIRALAQGLRPTRLL